MNITFHPFRSGELRIGGKTFGLGSTHKPHDLTADRARELIAAMTVPVDHWPEVEVHILEQGSTGEGVGLSWKSGGTFYILVEAGLGGTRYIPEVTLIHEFGHVFDDAFLNEHDAEYHLIRPEARQDTSINPLEYIAEDFRVLCGPMEIRTARHKGIPPTPEQAAQLTVLFERAWQEGGQAMIAKLHLPVGSPNRPGRVLHPKGVGVHRTGNASRGANARMHHRYFLRDDADSSYQYIVDDTGIYELIPPTEQSYHGGGWANSVYIGTAICENADGDFTKAYRNLVILHAHLLGERGWQPTDLHGHFEWNPVNRPLDPIGLFDWQTHLRDVQRLLTPEAADPCAVLRLQLDAALTVVDGLERKLKVLGATIRALKED